MQNLNTVSGHISHCIPNDARYANDAYQESWIVCTRSSPVLPKYGMHPDINSLINKYPKILGHLHVINCDNCWFDLLDIFCQSIQQFADMHSELLQPVALQVSYVNRRLRITLINSNDTVDGMVYLCQQTSANSCAKCGILYTNCRCDSLAN